MQQVFLLLLALAVSQVALVVRLLALLQELLEHNLVPSAHIKRLVKAFWGVFPLLVLRTQV